MDSSALDYANSGTLPPVAKNCFDRSASCTSPRTSFKANTLRVSGNTNALSASDEDDAKAQENVITSLRKFKESPSLNYQDSPALKIQPLAGDLPPAYPIANDQYSMEADMLFGWKPKFVMKAPIPLKFSSPLLEDVISTIQHEGKTERFPEIVYQGFRPENTFFLHNKFASPETYSFKLPPALQSRHAIYWKLMNNSVNPPRPFVGMKKDASEDCLVFDSTFEHGNLDTVIRKAKDEYDLFLKVDSNTRGHTCWYYFKVQNMQKGQTVKFNIVNLSRSDSLYQRGLKPYLNSKKLFEEKKIEWEQAGENVTYKSSYISYLGENFEDGQKRYYKLSFEYTFPYDDDVVSFALCIPYSYSQMLQFVQTMLDAQKDGEEGIYLTTSKLCFSLGGVNVPLLTITDPDESDIPLCKRQYIVCSARVHPGESNSSWMMQGFITEICKPTREARYLRKRFIFKIIPMLNPDGVIVGNHRTGICGNDLNRQYMSPQDVLHPTVVSLKDLIRDLTQERKDAVFGYFDFHGHSLMKSVFMYGAEFPIHSINYYRIKLLPKILSKRTQMFRFRACAFTIPKCKLSTARAVFSMYHGIIHCYTIEASYASYLTQDKESIPFTKDGYLNMGAMLVQSINEYKKLIEEEELAALAFKMRHEDFSKQVSEMPEPENGIDDMSPRLDEKGELRNGADSEDKKRANRFRIKKNKGKSEDSRDSRDKRSKTKEKKGSSVLSKVIELNTGISRLIEEIKIESLKKVEDDAEGIIDTDRLSKGGSDNEAADDDFDADDMESLQDDILYNITEFSNICKEEKIDPRTYKLRPKIVKPKKPAVEDKPRNLKERRMQTQSPEKDLSESFNTEKKSETITRNNLSPPKPITIIPKPYQKTVNWASRLREKVPLMPRKVEMVVDKSMDLSESQDQSIGSIKASKNAFRRYITSSYSQKKQKEIKEIKEQGSSQVNKTMDSGIQNMKTFYNDQANNIFKPNQIIKEKISDITSLKPPMEFWSNCISNNITRRPSNNVRKIEQEPEVPTQSTIQKSLKALLGNPKIKQRSYQSKKESYSFDCKDIRHSSEQIVPNFLPLNTETEDWAERENPYDVSRGLCENIIPQTTTVPPRVRAEYVVNGALSLKKDKRLPISYLTHKKTMFLKKKVRDQTPDRIQLFIS